MKAFKEVNSVLEVVESVRYCFGGLMVKVLTMAPESCVQIPGIVRSGMVGQDPHL